ncbi:helix-turn-helix domain-containing protein [Acinetobacter baumannii]|uniref:helix-turn-helix domain-containing protein n=1 Tax=Acinetobacter baumannii TaxID=470 RepID=UPI0038912E49
MLFSTLQENLHISEPDKHTGILDGWNLIYDQLSGGKFESHLNELSFDGIQIYQEKIKPSIFQRGKGLKNSICLGLFAELSQPALWMGKEVSSHEILSVYDGGDILLRSPENSSFYSLTIPFELLIEESVDLKNTQYSKLLDVEKSELFYIHYIKMFNYILHNSHVLKNISTRRQLKSDLIGITAQFLETMANKKENIKLSKHRAQQVVLTACDVMQAESYQFHSIDELCNITHTSRRTLQNCFEQVTGQSPAAFMKKLRLNAVKRELSNPNSNKTIADIAMDWGFWHLSQFAADYKKFFGECPSKTLTNHRLTATMSGKCS